jgi:hypothetical protein
MAMTREVNRWLSLALLGMLIWSGCSGGGSAGPKTAKATGVVTYKGQPVAEAIVVFLGDGKTQAAQALTNDDGLFVLTTTQPGDGAVPGNHVVTVTKVVGNLAATPKTNVSMEDAVKAGQAAAKESKPLYLVPQKYSEASSSPLRFTVKEGEKNHFEIKLED